MVRREGHGERRGPLGAGGAQSPVVDSIWWRGTWRPGDDAERASVKGRFDWPRVEITAGEIAMPKVIRSRARRLGFSSEGNLRRHGRRPGPTRDVGALVPTQPEFATMTFKAQASGPLGSLTHTGTPAPTCESGRGLNPLALAITWRVAVTPIEDFTAKQPPQRPIFRGGSSDSRAGAVNKMTLAKGDTTYLKLTAPATVR